MKTTSQPLTNWTDLELIQAFQASGRERYFNELFKRYYPLVYAKCLGLTTQREDSKDLTIIVFTKVYDLLATQQFEKFDHWLYTITHRECINFLRIKAKKTKVRKRWWEYQQHAVDGFLENEAFRRIYYEEELIKDQLYQDGLKELPETQRICLQLFTVEQKSYREIAEATSFPVNKVKSYLQNARRQLKIWVSKKIDTRNGK